MGLARFLYVVTGFLVYATLLLPSAAITSRMFCGLIQAPLVQTLSIPTK
jgi:hypothetical protein